MSPRTLTRVTRPADALITATASRSAVVRVSPATARILVPGADCQRPNPPSKGSSQAVRSSSALASTRSVSGPSPTGIRGTAPPDASSAHASSASRPASVSEVSTRCVPAGSFRRQASRTSSRAAVHSPSAHSSPGTAASAASTSRPASAAPSAGTPSAASSSARASVAAPSVRKAGRGQTPAAENTVPPGVSAPAQRTVRRLAARVVVMVTPVPPPITLRLRCGQPHAGRPLPGVSPSRRRSRNRSTVLVSIPPPSGPQHPQDPYAAPPPQPQGGYPPPQLPYGGAPGSAPYGLYGPYGPRPPAAVNGVAIASLVLGLLCFLPAVGLVLGLIALRQIRRRDERGRGMAVAGSVLSSVGLALWVVALSTGAAADFWQGFRDGARADTVLALRKGDCFNSPGGLEGWATEATTVPCARAHDGEVFAVLTRPDGSYPGDDRLTDLADERCYALQDAYVMDGWALPDHVAVYYLVPSRQSWRYGDREITCVFGHQDGKSKLTGSLRRDETTLDTHQVTYLEASEVLNTAMEKALVTEFDEDDLPAQRTWAREVADALAEQTGMLREHRWPDDARRPVAELTEELEQAEKEWTAAAEAPDMATYYDHYDKGWALLDARKSVTARKALGLATTPPDPEEAEERDPEGGAIEV